MNHIIRLVDDLLDVSRYTLGKIELKRVPVELQVVLHSALEMSQPLIEAGGHQLDVSAPPEPPSCWTPTVCGLHRCCPICSTMPPNTPWTGEKSRSSAQVQGDEAVLRVRDNGVGIPRHMLDRVFDLFTQIDRANDSRGAPDWVSGWPWCACWLNCTAARLRRAVPGPVKGSEFIVRLPVLPAESAAGAKPNAVGQGVSLAGRRILVVDDNYDAADSLCMLLKLAGAEVDVAYDGPGALAAVPVHRPHIVLLDVGMPGMDGYELAQRIRAHPLYQDITMIALSGWGQVEDRLRSHAAGFRHHLTKPVDFDVLQALLRSLEYAREG